MKYLKLYESFNDNPETPEAGDYIVITSTSYARSGIIDFFESHVGKVIEYMNNEQCKISFDEIYSDKYSDGGDDYYYTQLCNMKYILFKNKEKAEEYLKIKKYNL